ncbi:MAG TPA: Clp protease N-terminal domain-containing protein [Pseudonocardiaceae bacterium]|nr:Clp protease N-terminal domain-containing protein [Pseudonocardiaceae bacterium]
MPKINVYLPDDLAEAVKEAGLPVSPICQRALEAAVRRVAGIRETARLDLTLDDPTAKLANFTVKARTAVSLAIKAARDGGVALIGTEHLLAGLLDEGGNLALQVLRSLEIEPDDLREDLAARASADGEVEREIAGRQLDTTGAEALRTALTEAINFGHNYIGCEHLLLGLINEPDGAAGEILRSRGAELRLARRAVAATLSGYVYAKTQTGGDQSGAEALRKSLSRIQARMDRLEEQVAGLGEDQ